MIWYWAVLVLVLAVADGKIVFQNDPQAQNLSGDEILQAAAAMDPLLKARADKLLSRAVGRLSLEMENAIVKSNSRNNIVFSPLSIACALGLVLLGARGETFKEVANLLGVSTGIDLTGRSNLVHEELGSIIDRLRTKPGLTAGLEVSIANAIFVEQTFTVKESFLNISRQVYRSEVLPMDFQHDSETARKQMNSWVENQTEFHIRQLFQTAPSPYTKVIIANAIYFNGEWEFPFYPSQITKMKPFLIGVKDGQEETIDLPLMVNNAEIPYFVDEVKKCTIIGLPYKNYVASMYIVIPEDNIHDFVNKLTVTHLEELVDSTNTTSVIYFVPRMKLESTINLRQPLEDLGVKTLFRPEVSDLSGIADGVFANEAIHKVDIEVTETGTVAAASTAISIFRDGTTPVVKVDRPFLFFIRHNDTKVILFWGTVTKPKPFFHTLHHIHSHKTHQ